MSWREFLKVQFAFVTIGLVLPLALVGATVHRRKMQSSRRVVRLSQRETQERERFNRPMFQLLPK